MELAGSSVVPSYSPCSISPTSDNPFSPAPDATVVATEPVGLVILQCKSHYTSSNHQKKGIMYGWGSMVCLSLLPTMIAYWNGVAQSFQVYNNYSSISLICV